MPLQQMSDFVPTKRAMTLFDEFKAFAFKGNVIDLAVGVIIGVAFGAVVNSLVKDVIMPLIGVLLPGQAGYVGWVWTIRDKEVPYGRFLGEVVNFLIVSAAVFLFIKKFLGWMMRARMKEEAAPLPPLTKDQVLLTEIRDLLKNSATPHVDAPKGTA